MAVRSLSRSVLTDKRLDAMQSRIIVKRSQISLHFAPEFQCISFSARDQKSCKYISEHFTVYA